MSNIVVLIKGLKWFLIFLTILVNGMLVWKILRRQSLHTLFNLSLCFFFSFAGTIFPFMINEYGALLSDMVRHPNVPQPERCQIIYICRILGLQVMKVFLLNVVFRYIIVSFCHYGLGLSNSFSTGGTRHWILRVSYTTVLMAFVVKCMMKCLVTIYKQGMQVFVQGRICLLLRLVNSCESYNITYLI